MCLLVDFLETIDREMSVNLSGGKVGMTEEILDNTEIRAVSKKMGGEGMTKLVWRNVHWEICQAKVFFQ